MSLSLGATIRSMRERKLMTQKDLGDLLGITAQAVSKWEIGKAEPDSESIRRLCQIFEVSADELFGMHRDDQVSIGERLCEIRTIKCETQEQVADAVGISYVSLSRYENGARVPKIDILSKLADHYNMTIDELIGKEKTPSPLDGDISAMIEDFSRLSPADRRRVLDFCAGILSAREP